MLILLIVAYYLANNSLVLFPASAEQFHDVLHSIPILRPFSRSVQFANALIRFKQFVSEAPAVLLLVPVVPFVWRRGVRHTFAIATSLVALSWLLLEGSEINYLIQILPLLFLGFAIAVSRLADRWSFAFVPALLLAIVVFIFGWRDSAKAFENASSLDASNQEAARIIVSKILSSWPRDSKPLVLTEPVMLDRLSQDSSIRIMTDHFISFPMQSEPLDSFFVREQVNYAVLYNSPVYPKDRPRDDPFYQSVEQSGQLIARYAGRCGDMGRDYFHSSNWEDTILLFKLNAESAPQSSPK